MVQEVSNIDVIKYDGFVFCPHCDFEIPLAIHDSISGVRHCRNCQNEVWVEYSIDMYGNKHAKAEKYYPPLEQIKRGIDSFSNFLRSMSDEIMGGDEDD